MSERMIDLMKREPKVLQARLIELKRDLVDEYGKNDLGAVAIQIAADRLEAIEADSRHMERLLRETGEHIICDTCNRYMHIDDVHALDDGDHQCEECTQAAAKEAE